MKKKLNLLTALALSLVLLLALAPSAGAATIDPDTTTGSIRLVLKGKGTEATLYRIGVGKIENSNLVFELQSALKDALGEDLELNSLKAAEVEAVAEKLAKNEKVLKAALANTEEATNIWVTTATEKVNEGYETVLTEMPVGVYLVVQSKAHSEYENFDPFLLYLPAYEDGKWGDASASPKSTEIEDEPDDPTPPPEEIPDNPPPTDPGNPPSDPGEPPEDIPEEEVPLATLPQTGMLQWPVPVMAAAGLLLFVVGFTSEQRRKARME